MRYTAVCNNVPQYVLGMKGVWDARWLWHAMGGSVKFIVARRAVVIWQSDGNARGLVSPLVPPPQSFQVREERGVWRGEQFLPLFL